MNVMNLKDKLLERGLFIKKTFRVDWENWFNKLFKRRKHEKDTDNIYSPDNPDERDSAGDRVN